MAGAHILTVTFYLLFHTIAQTFIGELLFPTSKQMMLQVPSQRTPTPLSALCPRNVSSVFLMQPPSLTRVALMQLPPLTRVAGHWAAGPAYRAAAAQDDGARQQVHDGAGTVQVESHSACAAVAAVDVHSCAF